MKAVVMAGGEGTRLRPLTSNQPKPMVPIVGKPCIEHILDLLREHGFDDVIVTLAVYARGVNLYFIYGVALADPHRLLIGSGNQGRFIRLESAAMLDRPEINELVAAAIAESDTPLPRSGRGYVVIKSVSATKRPRRR